MSPKKYKHSLFIFRRDLRVFDNRGLLAASHLSERVSCAFIFDPRQVQAHPYRSQPAFEFMLNSLLDLRAELLQCKGVLSFFYGNPSEIVDVLLNSDNTKALGIEAIFFNRDYTPFAIQRDQRLKLIADKRGVDVKRYADSLLFEPEEVSKLDGKPYSIYTPFSKKAFSLEVKPPISELPHNLSGDILPMASVGFPKEIQRVDMQSLVLKGGRKEGVAIVESLAKLVDYDNQRNFPAIEGTTRLSAHNKFGTISAREIFATVSVLFGREHTLNKELLWRDFFTHIGFHFPHVFERSFNPAYDSIEWSEDVNNFDIWCRGETGFPIVDAGMRELNQTGFMHNRVRMIVASFLTKDLHISWRWGEKYFAQHLIDYDPAVNNGNWQWAASCGCDAQPYFRIFNPNLQQAKFDPECSYIKKWIPELSKFSATQIHQGADDLYSKYPRPILRHSEAKKLTEMLYDRALKGASKK